MPKKSMGFAYSDPIKLCIYCERDSSRSVRQAHVYPQCLYFNDVTLPLGAECDDCNEYHGQLEQALLWHNRIWPIIMMKGIPGKDQKARKQLNYITRNRQTGDIKILKRGKLLSASDGQLQIQLPDPGNFDDPAFRRALYHIAYNHLALLAGVSEVLRPEYRLVRRYIRYSEGRKKWPYAQYMYPEQERPRNLGVSWLREAPGTIVQIKTFLDDFYVELTGEGISSWWIASRLPSGTLLL